MRMKVSIHRQLDDDDKAQKQSERVMARAGPHDRTHSLVRAPGFVRRTAHHGRAHDKELTVSRRTGDLEGHSPPKLTLAPLIARET